MTEENMVNDSSAQEVNSSNASINNESSSLAATKVVDAPKIQEKSFNQYQVNDIVKNAKKEEADRIRREYDARIQQLNSSNVNQSMGGINNLTEEKIRQIFEQETKRLSIEASAKQIANEFVQKLSAGKSKYSDFDEKIGALNLASVPQIVEMANSLDNTADVIYEIANNPSKFSSLMILSHTAPHLAAMELQRLSSSIKQNAEASKQQKAPEPLSQLKPSTLGTDNGSMSLKDFKKAAWLQN